MQSLAGVTRELAADCGAWLQQFVCVIARVGLEDRGRIPMWDDLLQRAPAAVVEVSEIEREEISLRREGEAQQFNLRDSDGLAGLFKDTEKALIDLSGLAHPTWTALIRAALASCKEVWAMYAEPESYRTQLSPASRSIFDLSAKIRGLEPLPGLANLRGQRDYKEAVFVALLGFEGDRAWYLASQLDPVPRVIPVIGVPGFRIEYPTITVSCNREFLDETSAYASTRFARANCPFEAYNTLRLIQQDNPNTFMYLAPVGTKPHALGAILFALNAEGVEVMYDHPVRQSRRTSGTGRIIAYQVQ